MKRCPECKAEVYDEYVDVCTECNAIFVDDVWEQFAKKG